MGRTLSGPLFQADKLEWELGKYEERLSIIVLGLRVVEFIGNSFREMNAVAKFHKLNLKIKKIFFTSNHFHLNPM